MKTRTLLLMLGSIAVAACSPNDASPELGAGPGVRADPSLMTMAAAAPAPAAAALVHLEARSGSSANGELELRATERGVLIDGEIGGLTAGSEHGFHVHEFGDCSAPDASSAGGHFNPHDAPHGPPAADQAQRHLGDMPNVVADANGSSRISVAVPGATLHDGGAHDLVGKSVVVHEKRDDHVSQPSGDSGGRIACGVIR